MLCITTWHSVKSGVAKPLCFLWLCAFKRKQKGQNTFLVLRNHLISPIEGHNSKPGLVIGSNKLARNWKKSMLKLVFRRTIDVFVVEELIINCQVWDGNIIEVPGGVGAKFNLIWKVDFTETLRTLIRGEMMIDNR